MKKFFLLVLISSTFLGALAQQIPNNSFEQWTTGSNADPVGYATLDGLLFADLVAKSTDAHDGSFSVKLETQDLSFGRIPGIMFCSNDPAALSFGVPYTAKPTKLKGWVKHIIPGIDSATFVITLTRFNNATQQTDGVAVAQAIFQGNQTSWTPFEADFQYELNDAPDTILVLAASSITDSINTQLSQIWFDNIILEGVSGSLVFNPIEVSLLAAHPNPTAGGITVYTPDYRNSDMLVLTDLTGRVLLTQTIQGQTNTLQIAEAGIYLLEMKNANGQTIKRSRIVKQ